MRISIFEDGPWNAGGVSALPPERGNGGTIQATGSFSTPASLWLDNQGGNATIDPAGYTATLSGSLTGSGNLIESGSGKLILSGMNSFYGGTTVSGGELVVMDGEGLPDGSNLIVGDAAAFAPIAAADAPPRGSPAAPVPEPGTLALAVAAAVALASYRWRRTRRCGGKNRYTTGPPRGDSHGRES
jgi:autotransporter-associated beta strand protein